MPDLLPGLVSVHLRQGRNLCLWANIDGDVLGVDADLELPHLGVLPAATEETRRLNTKVPNLKGWVHKVIALATTETKRERRGVRSRLSHQPVPSCMASRACPSPPWLSFGPTQPKHSTRCLSSKPWRDGLPMVCDQRGGVTRVTWTKIEGAVEEAKPLADTRVGA